jgi:hypothetical protein
MAVCLWPGTASGDPVVDSTRPGIGVRQTIKREFSLPLHW